MPQLPVVLPTPQSAIVFEYQRGEGEDPTRCVTIRREPNGDADYRFFKGPFREELFLSETSDGKRVFVDDAGFMEQARKHGVSPERILSTSEYCSVILGAPTNTVICCICVFNDSIFITSSCIKSIIQAKSLN